MSAKEASSTRLVVTLAAVAGYLFYAHLPHQVAGVPVAWFSAALYAGDFARLGWCMDENTRAQRGLHPQLVCPAFEEDRARESINQSMEERRGKN